MKKAVQIVDAVAKEVAEIVAGMVAKGVGIEKSARLLGKSISKNAKLARFLSIDDFSKGYSLYTDKERREKQLAQIAVHGFTSINAKRAHVINIVTSSVEAEVERKKAELTKGEILDDEQKEKLASQLLKYSDFVKQELMVGVKDLGLGLGVLEPVEVKEAEPALA